MQQTQPGFLDATVFLLHQLKNFLQQIPDGWDPACERFRVAWGNPLTTLAERHRVIRDFYDKHFMTILADDGYGWLTQKQPMVSIDMLMVDGKDGSSFVYGSIPIGLVFRSMAERRVRMKIEHLEMKQHANGHVDEIMKIIDFERLLYRALLVALISVTAATDRERPLLQRIADQYDPANDESKDADGGGADMIGKMMGSANGIFDVLMQAAESSDQLPANLKASMRNLKTKMTTVGMENGAEGMAAMLQETLGSGEMGGLLEELKAHTGDNPMFSGVLDLMRSTSSVEEKAVKITELTSNPDVLEQFRQGLAAA